MQYSMHLLKMNTKVDPQVVHLVKSQRCALCRVMQSWVYRLVIWTSAGLAFVLNRSSLTSTIELLDVMRLLNWWRDYRNGHGPSVFLSCCKLGRTLQVVLIFDSHVSPQFSLPHRCEVHTAWCGSTALTLTQASSLVGNTALK